MANASNKKKTRSERVAALELPPSKVSRTLGQLRRSTTLVRLGMCLLTAAMLCLVMVAWRPPFRYHEGYTPQYDMVARVTFNRENPDLTRDEKLRARSRVRYVYVQNPEQLIQLRERLRNRVFKLANVSTLAEMQQQAEAEGGTGEDIWAEFESAPSNDRDRPTQDQREEQFAQFHAALSGEEALATFEKNLQLAFAPFESRGLLQQLPPEHVDGNQQEILVKQLDSPDSPEIVKLTDVLIGDGSSIHRALLRQMQQPVVADRMFNWLRGRLPTTLTVNLEQTHALREEAAAAVPMQYTTYEVGTTLVPAGTPLGPAEVDLLRHEYQMAISQIPTSIMLARLGGTFIVVLGVFAICGYYLLKRQARVLDSFGRFSLMLLSVVLCVGLARMAAVDPWRAEVLPPLFFGMAFAIAYRQELAVLLAAAISLLITIAISQTLGDFVILFGSTTAAILLLTRIRSRSKLTKVALVAAFVAAVLTLTVGMLTAQPLKMPLLIWAGQNAAWAFLAGVLMTALLPSIENLFGVVTDISLLELGDVAHPLLQELVRRAPGTYNHSINVASIAESAAEAIGANGLLLRVGAYFHDIGKMFKPGYFIENQGQEANRHESLVPAMSTLIIIAHIKDGADLARQHRLPEAIVDFIEQHHGTTLVEYFFRRASEQSEANPDAGTVSESAFRYPGPKPQTPEAGILMLSDAVESASRVLVEPTPARIESLVRDISLKRLLDGQFDECGLTLRQLRAIENSLIKSLTAVYHGRVKYPDQRTA